MGIRTYRSGDGPYGGNSRARTPWVPILLIILAYAAVGGACLLKALL